MRIARSPSPLGRRPAQRSTVVLTALSLAAALAAASPSAARADENKAGPIMANLRFGPSFGIAPAGYPAQFVLQLDGGYAIGMEDNLYAVFTPQFQFGSATLITIPVGLQYDIPLPVKGLYASPRFLMGFATATKGGVSALAIIPEAGVKYVYDKKFNVGFEPFSLPVFAGPKGGPIVTYRLTFYGGMNF